jgi:lipid-binding SYLF domain-containing protein
MTLVFVLVSSAAFPADLSEKVADRLFEASKVLDELVNAPDGGIPKNLLHNAECVAVIPGVKKLALGFGVRYGSGAVSCRKDQGKGPWGPPSIITLGGGSFGFQVGGQAVDVVMLLMRPDSIRYLLRDKVTLGADVEAAAGPIGRAASAETSVSFRAEILTYSRSRGLFGGISLGGAVVRPDSAANKTLYKREVTAKELLEEGSVMVPEPADKFIQALTRSGS